MLANLGILEILESPQSVENKVESDQFSRDSREFRDFRDLEISSSETITFVMAPFSGPEFCLVVPSRLLENTAVI